ncbi:23S rRNA (pseudouridine(1915)-N(3))-methyltransferase RlmH [bacterium]|nr:23S rRNA (pseudouridine(1915)-N(3))-methyltransferase RlmH [bacterium]
MSKIHIIFVSSINDDAIEKKVNEYLKRISRYASVKLDIIKEEKIHAGNDMHVLKTEAERIRKKFKQGDYVICLTDKGKKFDTLGFKDLMNNLLINQKRILFVIGGPIGLEKELITESNMKLSLSQLTLQHDIALIVLLEQVFRAFTIMHGEKYHK